jgi:hypothetical protein
MEMTRRRWILAFVLGLALTGCKTVSAPLPTGAINTVDAQINAILQAGHAAVVQYDADVAAGFAPTAAYKAILSNLTNALNIADPMYQSYHATLMTAPSTAEPESLVTATAQVQNLLGQIPGTVGH